MKAVMYWLIESDSRRSSTLREAGLILSRQRRRQRPQPGARQIISMISSSPPHVGKSSTIRREMAIHPRHETMELRSQASCFQILIDKHYATEFLSIYFAVACKRGCRMAVLSYHLGVY
jgi:hypothetical protein